MEINFKNPDDVQKLQRRIKYAYNKITGYRDGWEDCSQDIIMRWMMNPGGGQTVDQAVIDYIRTELGRTGTVNHEARQKFNNALSLSPTNHEGNHPGNVVDPLDKIADSRCNHERYEIVKDFEKVTNDVSLSVRQRVVTKLYYVWGLKCIEIADLFGITESRVSQILECTQLKLKKKVDLNFKFRDGQVDFDEGA